jgi:hypothetical protein
MFAYSLVMIIFNVLFTISAAMLYRIYKLEPKASVDVNDCMNVVNGL